MRGSVVAASLVMTLVAGGARPSGAPAPADQPPSAITGRWGGQRIRIDVSATGARIQVDCLVASREGAVAVDDAGGFALAMTFAPIRGVALDGEEERPLSHVTGRLENDRLVITIAPKDAEPSGSFTLERNGKATLPNCRMRG